VARETTIAIVGTGSLANALAVALYEADYAIAEIIVRDSPGSLQSARQLSRKIGARAVTVETARYDAQLLWLCVSDGAIRGVA